MSAPLPSLARRAELVKLGRVLDVAPEELAAITPVELGELRALRESISATLFDDARPLLSRVAKGSRLLPTGLVARVGQAAFGAMLCSRIASLLAPDHALAVALHMPDAFLADVSAQIDPRTAGEVVSRIPTERVVGVAAILVARRDFVTMGRFVDYLSNETLAAVIASIGDELDLLHIATFVESPHKLGELVGMLPPPRLRAMIAALGASNGELWIEILAVANSLDAHWQRVIGDTAADLAPEVLEALVTAARRHDLWTSALPLVLAMSPESADRFLALPCVDDPAVLVALVDAAVQLDRWPELLPFTARMTPAMRARLAVAMQDRPRDVFDRIVRAARAPMAWPALLAIAADMHADAQHELAASIGSELASLLAPLAEAARMPPLWDALLPLAQRLAPAHRRTLVATLFDASAFDAATRRTMIRALLVAAEMIGRLDEVRPLVDDVG